MTRRFAVAAGTYDSDEVQLRGPLAQRLARVLRLQTGQEVVLFDGGGIEARVRLDDVRAQVVRGTVLSREPGPVEPKTRVHLYAGIPKSDRFDWLVEKATELGAASVVPLISARSVTRAPGENRTERWRRIATEAAEQCGRGRVPDVAAPVAFDAALRSAPGVVLVAYECAGEGAPGVGDALATAIDAVFALGEISLLVGPEGGFEPEEVERATAAAARVVTLGWRVLRVETAAIAALALVMQSTGELG